MAKTDGKKKKGRPGRPKAIAPKDQQITVRLDMAHCSILDKFSRMYGIKKPDVIRLALNWMNNSQDYWYIDEGGVIREREDF